MFDIFRTSLPNEFKSHFTVLKVYLGQRKNLTPLPNVTFLGERSIAREIMKKILFLHGFKRGKILKGASNAMTYIQSRVDRLQAQSNRACNIFNFAVLGFL
jgi:hypothetical protein